MKYIILLLAIVISTSLFATYQAPDILIWNKDTFEIYTSPLESNSKLSKAILDYNKTWESSGCWRGYIATWTLINDELYLKDVINYKDRANINFIVEKVLNKKFVNGLLKATMISSEFFCGQYPLWSMYHPSYEKEFKIKIQAGVLISSEKFEFNKCKYKPNSPVFKDHIKSKLSSDELSQIHSLIVITLQINSNGRILQCKKGMDFRFSKELFGKIKYAIMELPCIKLYSYEGIVEKEISLNIYTLLNDEKFIH